MNSEELILITLIAKTILGHNLGDRELNKLFENIKIYDRVKKNSCFTICRIFFTSQIVILIYMIQL